MGTETTFPPSIDDILPNIDKAPQRWGRKQQMKADSKTHKPYR